MNAKSVALIFAVAALFMTAAFIPSVDADNVIKAECNGVTISYIGDGIEMCSSDESSVIVHIHNDYPKTVTVSLSNSDGSAIKLSTSESSMLISSGTTSDIACTLSTDWSSTVGTYDLGIVMSVMNGTDPVSSVTLNVPVKVVSKYSESGQYNRFMGVIDNNLGGTLGEPWFTALITFIVWILISAFVAVLLCDIIKMIFRKMKADDSQVGKGTLISLAVCILLYGITQTLAVFGADQVIQNELGKLFDLLYAPLVAFIVWDLYKVLIHSAFGMKGDDGKNKLDPTLIPLFYFIGKLIIVVLAVATFLSICGLSLSAILAGAGVAGLGISLGSKAVINQGFSGLMLMAVRPFSSGDMVKVGSNEALIVSKVGLYQTEFRTDYSKDVIYMPNSKVASSTITNLTYGARTYCEKLTVKVPMDVDQETVKRCMEEAACSDKKVIINGSVPGPTAVIQEFGDRSITMRLEFYVWEYDDAGSTAGRIREAILKRFYENGIRVPMEAYEFNVIEIKGAGQ